MALHSAAEPSNNACTLITVISNANVRNYHFIYTTFSRQLFIRKLPQKIHLRTERTFKARISLSLFPLSIYLQHFYLAMYRKVVSLRQMVGIFDEKILILPVPLVSSPVNPFEL